ncbi:penicillin-binding protein activator LpoB [Treponema zuelzerae]|uniref:Penicillin-binding protein activator LpoB n=1 Tax=Teretinema zuelzerae TaxID=156 RepID=A0AAE3JJ91_9SPIR|nr:penicillin-binding protein activator LpoB [Teretinema zuelzerae]MBN2810381.1 penicillin-binding protein activator LpoB [Spirochaetales bacterium]MCD1653965.1 penicillin-binding protein activator LpoB [Teretinema zuelzerae]
MKVRSAAYALVASLLVFSGCASQSVSRVDSSEQIDLSGYWNDTDVKLVCETLINDCLASPRVEQAAAKKGDLPVIIVGSFRNDSDEHIDTSIITKRMETAILNSGKADFVASRSERSEIRDERTEQQSWANEDTAKALANETGADFILTGSVKTIVDKAGKTAVRTYFVYGELTDIESNRKIWIGENSDIKKVIKTASAKF